MTKFLLYFRELFSFPKDLLRALTAIKDELRFLRTCNGAIGFMMDEAAEGQKRLVDNLIPPIKKI